MSGQAQTFTRPVIEAMSRMNARPIVLALSNPTAKSECTAQAYAWSDGRAIFASGSPFPPVNYQATTIVPGQANNAYIFPGVGLGVISCGARRVTDEMFLTAAGRLSAAVGDTDLTQGTIYPPLQRIRDLSASIAAAIAELAYEKDLATEPRPDDLHAFIESGMYDPSYESYA